MGGAVEWEGEYGREGCRAGRGSRAGAVVRQGGGGVGQEGTVGW